MAVGLELLPIPRFDKSLLAYLDRSFLRVQKAISDLNRRSGITPQLFSWTLTNGASWPYAAIQANNSILTAPFPLRMVVQVTGNTGASPFAHGVNYQIQDEAGTPISPNTQFLANGLRLSSNGELRSFAMQATKDYSINQVCGFRFAYQVDAIGGAAVYNDATAIVSFWPRG